MFQFKSTEIKTQITCLKVIKHHILIAVGDHIYVYRKRGAKLVDKIQVFENQQICGIDLAPDHSKCLVYGGKNLKVFKLTFNSTENVTLEATLDESHNEIKSNHSSSIDEEEWILVTEDNGSNEEPSSEPSKKPPKVPHSDRNLIQVLELKELDWILVAKWILNGEFISLVTMNNTAIVYTNDLKKTNEATCEEKCILYSAYIYCDDSIKTLVVLSGTVFSEVIIWQPFRTSYPALCRLKGHKGVIFSIDYQLPKGLICTTSDDRSAILWHVEDRCLIKALDINDSNKVKVWQKCCVKGHLSRIFRSLILDSLFVTGGEDGFLCIWNFHGELISKIQTMQRSAIWAIEGDEKANLLHVGSGDGSVTTFNIKRRIDEETMTDLENKTPKHVAFFESGNMVVASVKNVLYHCDARTREREIIAKIRCTTEFAMSICRTMVAVGSESDSKFYINIFKEKPKAKKLLPKLYKVMILETTNRISSLHWLSCDQLLITYGRIFTLVDLKMYKKHSELATKTFSIPNGRKAGDVVTCALLVNEKHFIVGDRYGNIHLFNTVGPDPIKTIRQAHRRSGVVSLFRHEGKIKSIGRDGYLISYDMEPTFMQTLSDRYPYNWLLRVDGNFMLAFTANNFVVADLKNKQVVAETSCGGGHRSWDFLNNGQRMTFVYIKGSVIHSIHFNLGSILPREILPGFHFKNINALSAIRCGNAYVLISGGEDTYLHISSLQNGTLKMLETLRVHLSSIRAIDVIELHKCGNVRNFLLFTGGGRQQIITWFLKITEKNCSLSVTCQQHQDSYQKSANAEMRVMDLKVKYFQNEIRLFAGLSNGRSNEYLVRKNSEGLYIKSCCSTYKYATRCVSKVMTIKYGNFWLPITFPSNGKIVIWNSVSLKQGISYSTHQSGINSCSYTMCKDNKFLLLTGGDDNAITLNLFEIYDEKNELEKLDTYTNISVHCAQVTGAYITDKYFITASIDQRIAIFKWEVVLQTLQCEFLQYYNSCIPDIQGMQCFKNNDEDFDVFVFGCGIQCLKVSLK